MPESFLGHRASFLGHRTSKSFSGSARHVPHALRHRKHSIFQSEKVRHTKNSWVLCITLGVAIGLADGAMKNMIEWLFDVKMDLLRWSVANTSVAAASGLILSFALPLVAISFLLVRYVAPLASGSGLAEVKTLLNGTPIPGLLSFAAAFVKGFGVVLTIVAGLACGREGPMIHVGSAIASGTAHLKYFHRNIVGAQVNRRAKAVFNIKAETLNHYITMGGAAGIAAAFNAPIAGVIYMLEEMSTYWPLWMTMQAFVCTSTAALTMQLLSYRSIGSDSNAILGDHAILATTWTSNDVPLIILIGVCTGFYSTFLISYCNRVFNFRRKVLHKAKKAGYGFAVSAADVSLMTILAVGIAMIAPLAVTCSPVVKATAAAQVPEYSCNKCVLEPAPGNASEMVYNCGQCAKVVPTDGTHRHLSVADNDLLQYTCDPNYHNSLSELMFHMPEHSLLTMWTPGKTFDANILLSYLLMYSLQFVLLAGIEVPAGTTVPNMLMGGVLGRLIGEVAMKTQWAHSFSDPAVFSQIGAAGMLCGYTHMTITIAVLISEGIGSTDLIVPFCVTCLLSRFISESCNEDTADEYQLHKKDLFFLADMVPQSMHAYTAGDLMASNMQVLPTKISPLSGLSKIFANKYGLNHEALPVVSKSGRLCGVVSTEILLDKVQSKHSNIAVHSLSDMVLELAKQSPKNKEAEPQRKSWKRLKTVTKTTHNFKSYSPKNQKSSQDSYTPSEPEIGSSSESFKIERTFSHRKISSMNSLTRVTSVIKSKMTGTLFEQKEQTSTGLRGLGKMMFAVNKSINVVALMDAAPFVFFKSTPADRIYTTFLKMNLAMVCIVDEEMKPIGMISRNQLLESMKLAKGIFISPEKRESISKKLVRTISSFLLRDNSDSRVLPSEPSTDDLNAEEAAPWEQLPPIDPAPWEQLTTEK